MRDLAGDIMVGKSGDETHHTARYPQRRCHEIRVREARPRSEAEDASADLFENAVIPHPVEGARMDAQR